MFLEKIKALLLLSPVFVCASLKVSAQDINKNNTAFKASSSAFKDHGDYPRLYTCDSTGISPAIQWSGAPAGTKSFAITMHHYPRTGDKHVYIILYDIPANIYSIPEGVSGIGKWGANTVNRRNEYTPPCSVGPGPKEYIITVYALSSMPVLNEPARDQTMDALLNVIQPSILASSEIHVIYSRGTKKEQ